MPLKKVRKRLNKKSLTKKKESSHTIAELLSIVGSNFPNGSISLVDKRLNFLYTGGTSYTAYGIKPDTFIGRPLKDVLSPPIYSNIKKFLPKILKGKSFSQEIDVEGACYLYAYRPIKSKNGRINSFVIASQNITSIKAIENEHLKLLDVVQKSQNEIYIFNGNTFQYDYVNDGALNNLGYSMSQMKKMTVLDIKPEYNQESFEELIRPLRKRIVHKVMFETIHKRSDGSIYPVEVHQQLLRAGQGDQLVSIIIDITKRKTDEKSIQERNEELASMVEELNATTEELRDQNEKLQNSLAEKESLFKEIHHRIKNNLQMVLSLLYLKSFNSPDQQVLQFINETKSRIISISLLHEQLLQLKSINKLDIHVYLKALTAHIMGSYAHQESRFSLNFNVDHFELPTDQVVHLGLVTNEIISNIFKHAYPNTNGGPIHLTFTYQGDDCKLVIQDEGVGLPPNDNTDTRKSYGRQLIELFTEELKGNLDINSSRGTSYTITFKKHE